jgi:hypothetical protein
MKPETATKEDKIYHRPCVRDFGDLKKVTQGASGSARDGGEGTPCMSKLNGGT